MKSDGFIPHYECTVASGDCFRLSRCLHECRPKEREAARTQARIAALEESVVSLKKAIVALGKVPEAKQ